MSSQREPIYLDHHATTPCDPRVVEEMLPWFGQRGGNAASPHCFGWEAAEAVHTARERLARLFGVRDKDVIFTAGATESNNIVLQGSFSDRAAGAHLVTSDIEHPSIAAVADRLSAQGVEVTRVKSGPDGVVSCDAVERALRPQTRLCSIQWVNNEIGTIQPVREIAAVCSERAVPFHTDAAQAVARVDCDLTHSRISYLSASAHKFYGPVGVGVLVRNRAAGPGELAPVMVGGGQEFGLRPGTAPVALIVGMGVAAQLASKERERDWAHAERLRTLFQERLGSLEGVHLNGSAVDRVPGNLSLAFDGVEAHALLLELKNVGLSVGSACHSDSDEPSAVLAAIGVDSTRAHCTLRVGIGRPNTEEEVLMVADRIVATVRGFRADMPGGPQGARST